ncbi:MAG TPA: Lrp/AsnC family transcriptional regulator [Ktedonobacterales bacterium]
MTNEAEKLLDETGWALLGALQDDARASYAELGRLVGLTPPAVADRVRRLEQAGIITGYHATVDPAKLGLGLMAVIRFKSAQPWERTIGLIRSCPEIIAAHDVTGEDCMTLTAVVTSVAHLQRLVARLGAYGASNTAIVLSSPISHRAIGPEALAAADGDA